MIRIWILKYGFQTENTQFNNLHILQSLDRSQ